MAIQTPLKYNSTNKKHEIFVATDTIDPSFLPTITPSGVAGGDLGGSYPNPIVDGIQGIAVSATAPTAGQSLVFNGTNYVPQSPNTFWFDTSNAAPNGTTDDTEVIKRTGAIQVAEDSKIHNVDIGTGTGSATTFNTRVGSLSLGLNTTGNRLTAVGWQSLVFNTIGNYNSALGARSLRQMVDGNYNTAVGSQALENQATGDFNTAIGHNADANSSSGSGNTGVGAGTLGQLSSGSNNTAIGYNAAGGLLGNNALNTMIGRYSGSDISGNNNTVVGGNLYATGTSVALNDTMILGAGGSVRIFSDSAGNTGVGTTTPTQKLDVAGNLKFSQALMPNNTAGTAGQVLTSAGAGVAPTWTTPSAGVTLSSTVPVQDAVTTGVIGVGTTAARADHVHPFTHSLVLTQAAGLVYTHNGDPKTVAIPTGVVAQNIGFDSSGNPARSNFQKRVSNVGATLPIAPVADAGTQPLLNTSGLIEFAETDSIKPTIGTDGTTRFYTRNAAASAQGVSGVATSSSQTIINYATILQDPYSEITTGANWKYTAKFRGLRIFSGVINYFSNVNQAYGNECNVFYSKNGVYTKKCANFIWQINNAASLFSVSSNVSLSFTVIDFLEQGDICYFSHGVSAGGANVAVNNDAISNKIEIAILP